MSNNKAYKIIDNKTNLINEDKSNIHRQSVKSSLDSSIQNNLIKNNQYEVTEKNYTDYKNTEEINRHKKNQQDSLQHEGYPSTQSKHEYNQENVYVNRNIENITSSSEKKVKRYKSYSEQRNYNEYIDVEETTQNRPLYGNVEVDIKVDSRLSGIASGATLQSTPDEIIKDSKVNITGRLKTDIGSNLTQKINPTSKENAVEKINNKTKNISGSNLTKLVEREIEEKAVEDGDLTERTQLIGAKYGYKAGKYSALGTSKMVKGTISLSDYSKKLKKGVKSGAITKEEAEILLSEKAKSGIKGGSNSLKKILKEEAIKGLEDFHGSDDLGVQVLTKPKDTIIKSKRTIKTLSAGANKAKKGIKGVKTTGQKVAQKSIQATQYMYGVAKKTFASPLAIKSTITAFLIIILLGVLLASISYITTLIPTISLKSEDKEITRVYEHLTKMDSELTKEIRDIKESWFNRHIDEFHYFVNGYEVNGDNIEIYTNIDNILAFLDTKYDDYAFNKMIYGLFGGDNLKSEITNLHNLLYGYTTNEWTEEIEHSSTYTDENGNTHTDTWTEIIKHMDINVEMKSFDEYLYENIDVLLTEDEQERMNVLNEVGLYTSKINLSSPFDDPYYISSRWGWRIHPISGALSKHQGIDIPKPHGTPILNIMAGYVDESGYNDSYGNYVVVKSNDGKRKVLYAHMSSISISSGNVTKGDIIGKVGNTGTSTGDHLHLEYYIDGDFNTNPVFFLEGAYNGGFSGMGSDDIVQIALSQLGQVGGQPYWSWYGFGARVEWCAIFVSWSANQAGYIQDGTIPKFAGCQVGGVNWFKSQGQWQNRGYIPQAGDIIFFDWNGDNWSDHVGIVISSNGSTVETVEGNSGNAVKRKTYNINSYSIMGYGIPNY